MHVVRRHQYRTDQQRRPESIDGGNLDLGVGVRVAQRIDDHDEFSGQITKSGLGTRFAAMSSASARVRRTW